MPAKEVALNAFLISLNLSLKVYFWEREWWKRISTKSIFWPSPIFWIPDPHIQLDSSTWKPRGKCISTCQTNSCLCSSLPPTSTLQQNLALLCINSINQIFQVGNLIIHDPSLTLVFEANKSLRSCCIFVVSILEDFSFVVSFYASPLLLFNTALCLWAQTWSLTAWVPIWAVYLTSCVTLRKLFNMSRPQFPDLYNGDNDGTFHGCCESLYEMSHCMKVLRIWYIPTTI